MPTPDLNEIIQEQVQDLYERHFPLNYNEVASYYPPDMEAERDRFAIAYTALDGATFQVGDYDFLFPLHSISKLFSYGVALEDNGRQAVLNRVGVEPSGNSFNSFTFDVRHNRPFNPMVNAGALVVTSLIRGSSGDEKVQRVLEKLRLFAANPDLQVDEEVLAAQLYRYNDRNLGLSYLMRSLGMIDGDIEENVRTYLAICCVHVTVRDLATMGATLGNGGVNPLTGDRVLSRLNVRDVLSVMSTCGMYDYAGEWLYDVGFPAKSSVSGALLFAVPNSFSGGIFSPGLDVNGNSVRGVRVCRDLSERFGLHVYADPAEERFGLTTADWVRAGRGAETASRKVES